MPRATAFSRSISGAGAGWANYPEVFGPAFVEQDKATRLFVYRADMRTEWASYSTDAEQITRYFVTGINAYIDWLVSTWSTCHSSSRSELPAREMDG